MELNQPFSGTAFYEVYISGSQIPSFELDVNEPMFSKISLKKTDCKNIYHFTISMNNYIPSKHSIELNKSLMKYLSITSYCIKATISPPKLLNGYFSDIDKATILSSTFNATASGFISTDILPKDFGLLKVILLSDISDVMLLWIGQFYQSLQLTDNVSKFISLYSLLLAIEEDKQLNVDNFIFNHFPETIKVLNTHFKSPRSESIYTSLRNKLSHNNSTCQINEIRNEMSAWINNLIDIVKYRIETVA